MHKYGADAGGFGQRVQQPGVAAGASIRAEQRPARTPAAAGDQGVRLLRGKRNEVRCVQNELRVEPQRSAERAFNLSQGVIARLQTTDRELNQAVKRRDIGWLSRSDAKVGGGLRHDSG